MTSPSATRARESACSDCGGIVRDRDFYDPDNRDNVAGVPPCDCRPRQPTLPPKDH